MQQRFMHALPVMLLGSIGVAVSISIETVHRRLLTDAGYTSFCNVGEGINCDVVLSSPYSMLAGVSLSLLAIAFYGGVVGAGAGTVLSNSARRRALLGTVVFAMAVSGLLFSLYMAFIAFVVLRTLCLLCASLYVVSVALLPAAWFLRQRTSLSGPREKAEAVRTGRTIVAGSVLAAAVLVGAGVWEALRPRTANMDAETIAREDPEFYRWFFAQPVVHVEEDSDRAVGPSDATVTVVEFSDFECGHCAKFDTTLHSMMRSRKPVRVIFRHFPLDSACNDSVAKPMHPNACLAAVAAECAREQGEFWEYKKLLFENQQKLQRQYLIGYARQLGLDETAFVTCLGSAEARGRVERDVSEGVRLGIESTPTVFINGRQVLGALSAEHLQRALVLAVQPEP